MSLDLNVDPSTHMHMSDSDDMFVESGPAQTDVHVPHVRVSYYGNAQVRHDAIIEHRGGQGRGGRGDFAPRRGRSYTSSGDARQHGREVATNSGSDSEPPPTKRINHGSSVPASADVSQLLVVSRPTPSGPQDLVVRTDTMASSVVTQQDNTALLQSFGAMLNTQHGIMMQAMTHQQELNAAAAKRHMEVTVQRAALENSARALDVEEERITRDIVVARSNADDTTSADWHRQQQDRLVRELELRVAQLGVRKSALEQQYQLLNDAHEDVGVRPSLW